jgi:PKD repeat protein
VVSGVGNGLFNATGTKVASATTITSHTPEPSIVGTPVTVGVSVSGSGGPPTGQVTVAGDGALAGCTITLANGSGSCAITFAQTGNRDVTATYGGDTRFSGSSATEKHQVNPAPNAAPVAQNDTYDATEDLALTVPAPGVLANDNDPEGGPLTAVNASNPARGTVQLNGDGSFTYTPDQDLAGADQFTYSARDAAGSTTSATVTINVAPVNDPPTGATFVPPNCSAGVPCTFEAQVSDPDQGDVLTYDWDFGDATPHGSGSTVDHTYLAAGPVTVTLTVTDSAGASDSHSDTFTVNP